MRSMAAALAVITLLAGAAHAQGQGNGKDKDRGGGKPAETGRQGGGNADRGDRGQGNDGPSMAQSMRGSEQRGNGNAMRKQRGNERAAERVVERAAGNRGRGNENWVVASERGERDRGAVVRVRNIASIAPRGLIEGCPPGLAKKNPPCVPPGQVRNDVLRWDRPDFWGLSSLAGGRYFYDDGYLVRYGSSGGVLGYVPLLGGALAVGNAWPSFYEPLALPGYYERYYGLGPYDSYRYADQVIYRVDPDTTAITSIAALLTGDDFAIGQQMPLGYDVYNVPWGYRDRYVDGPDAHYRYSDGHIYQADPKTKLIAAAIELLAS